MATRNKSSFDDHLAIVTGSAKTASLKPSNNHTSLLQKLAAELNIENTPVAPVAPGAPASATPAPIIVNAATPVGDAGVAVEGATAAVADAQVALAGGVPAIAAEGMAPAATTGDESGVITSGDGSVKSIDLFGKDPAAAVQEAEKVGMLIAQSFVANLEKIAKQNEYSAALGILKTAGLLANYSIKDEGMSKVAGAEVDYLEKIASRATLSHDDIIGAAHQYQEFVKVAEEAEAAGEKDADDLVEALNEVADEEAEAEKDDEDSLIAAEAIKDPEIAAALKVLQDKGVV